MRVEGTHIQCLRSDKISMHKVTWPLARAVKCRANPTFVTKDAMHDQVIKHTITHFESTVENVCLTDLFNGVFKAYVKWWDPWVGTEVSE